jgi:3-methyladenine DNA glycosylase AlkC
LRWKLKTTLNTEKKIAKILAQISTIKTQYSDEKIADILENIKNELAEIV